MDQLAAPRADGEREALRILLVARQEITVMCTADQPATRLEGAFHAKPPETEVRC
ncbi:hypothetical protein [Actinoallomurus oryzae]|uniref:hypothetical protein n=1 Tax=Actinoallomurus oryzae TaxID=502180 RepID=UPI0031E9071F